MQLQVRSKQRGISFIGLVLVCAFLAGLGVLIAQAIPTYTEYQAVLRAVKKAKDGSSVQDVRTIFDKQAQIDDIKSIAGKDLDVSKQGDQVVVGFAYNREIPIFGPAYLLLKYTGTSQ